MVAAPKPNTPPVPQNDPPGSLAPTGVFSLDWYRFLAGLGELGIARDHHAHVLQRVHEITRVPGATEPHVEVIADRDALVFTWNDGANYLDLSVRPDGSAAWFFDDGRAPTSGRCGVGERLPAEFCQRFAVMRA